MSETLKVTNGIVQCPITSTGLPIRHNESIERCKYDCNYSMKFLINENLIIDTVLCSFKESYQGKLPKNL